MLKHPLLTKFFFSLPKNNHAPPYHHPHQNNFVAKGIQKNKFLHFLWFFEMLTSLWDTRCIFLNEKRKNIFSILCKNFYLFPNYLLYISLFMWKIYFSELLVWYYALLILFFLILGESTSHVIRSLYFKN